MAALLAIGLFPGGGARKVSAAPRPPRRPEEKERPMSVTPVPVITALLVAGLIALAAPAVDAQPGALFTPVNEPPPVGQLDHAAAQDPTDPTPIDLGDITALPQPAFRPARLAGAAAAVQTYQFTLTAAQAVGLGLRQQDADADLYLADATGTERGRSEAAGTAKEWIQATLLAGTYTVRVEAREAGENQYVLRYGVSAPDADEVARLEAERDDGEDSDDDDENSDDDDADDDDDSDNDD